MDEIHRVLGAIDATIGVPAPREPAPFEFVVRDGDGSLRVLTASTVAKTLEEVAYGADVEHFALYSWLHGRFQEVAVVQKRTTYDSDDYAYVDVRFVGADGRVLAVEGYRIDGRA